MDKKKTNIEDLIIPFYLTPFLLSVVIIIFIEGEIIHISGHKMIGLQARLFAFFLIIMISYFIYYILYKLPFEKGGKKLVKKIWLELLNSQFLYIFIITILFPIFFKLFLPKYLWLIFTILIYIVCFLYQFKFFNNIRKYIK